MTVEPKHCATDIHGNELTGEEKEWAEENFTKLDGFSKTNWKNAMSRDNWAEMLQGIRHARHEAEWRSVLSDKTDRDCAIVHVDHNTRDKWLQRIGEHDLHYRQIRYTSPYSGFAHKFHPADPNDPEKVSYAVVSHDEAIAEHVKATELERSGWDRHNQVGKYLGFPQCCREFFYKHFVQEDRKDPMYEVACNTGCAEAIDGDRMNIRIPDPEPATNILWRYFGLSYLTHMPCSWDCEKSKDVARARWEIMAENGYEDEANQLYHWLGLPAVWTGKNGIGHIQNEHMIGSAATSTYWNKKKIVWGSDEISGGDVV